MVYYHEGYDARQSIHITGFIRPPYPRGTFCHAEWLRGWNEADMSAWLGSVGEA